MIRIGIDLGTDHIKLVNDEDEILFDEPCMIALDRNDNVLAIGKPAAKMKDNTDETIRVISPFANGEIDFEALDALLEQLCYDYRVFRMFQKTILVVSYPTNLAYPQREMLKQHLVELGAWRVYFEPEIWISAIGAKIDINLPAPRCVMNIGSSNCDIAVFSSGRIKAQSSYGISGHQVDLQLQKWMRKSFGMNISEHEAKRLKRHIGTVREKEKPSSWEVKGIDIHTRKPKTVTVDQNMVAVVLQPLCGMWANWIYRFLTELDRQQQEDIKRRGIVCCGGTMMLDGLAEAFRDALSCPFFVTDHPIHTVPHGLYLLLSRMDETD